MVTSIHHSDRYTVLSLLDNAAMTRYSASRVDEAGQCRPTLPLNCLFGKQTQIVEESRLALFAAAATQSPGDTLFVKPGTVSRCHRCDVLQRTYNNSRSPHYKTIYTQNVKFIPLHSAPSPKHATFRYGNTFFLAISRHNLHPLQLTTHTSILKICPQFLTSRGRFQTF